jgi:hypothetical protein
MNDGFLNMKNDYLLALHREVTSLSSPVVFQTDAAPSIEHQSIQYGEVLSDKCGIWYPLESFDLSSPAKAIF